ncbi:MAG: hypothetical protein ABEK59_00890 [Halobacteria archaeon]
MPGKTTFDPVTNRKIGSGVGRGKLTENREMILNYWKEEDVSVQQLANLFDCTLRSMTRFLRENGFPFLRESKSADNTYKNYQSGVRWGENELIDFLVGVLLARGVSWEGRQPALVLGCGNQQQASRTARKLSAKKRDTEVVIDDPDLLDRVCERAGNLQDWPKKVQTYLAKLRELQQLQERMASLKNAS